MKSLFFALIATLAVVGCSTEFDPFEAPAAPAALYAALSADRGEQIVRIEPVTAPGSLPPNAQALLIEEGGDTLWLRLRGPAVPGGQGAVFIADTTARAGGVYRVEGTVSGDFGERSVIGRLRLPPRYSGQVDTVTVDTLLGLSQVLTWQDLRANPSSLVLTYFFGARDSTNLSSFTRAYGAGFQTNAGYAFNVRLGRDINQFGPTAAAFVGRPDSLRLFAVHADLLVTASGAVDDAPGELVGTARSLFEWTPPDSVVCASLGCG